MKKNNAKYVDADGAEIYVRVDDGFFGRSFWLCLYRDSFELVTPDEAEKFDVELTPTKGIRSARRWGRDAMSLARSCGYDFGGLSVSYWVYDGESGEMAEVRPARGGRLRLAE